MQKANKDRETSSVVVGEVEVLALATPAGPHLAAIGGNGSCIHIPNYVSNLRFLATPSTTT